jgi:DNA modification methylase
MVVSTFSQIECSDYRDFLRSLGRNSVDLVLTDPPYAVSRKTGFSSVKNGVQRFAVSMDFGDWDHQQIDLTALALETYRVLRRGGTAIVWYDMWKIGKLYDALADAGFKMLRLIVWNKTNPVPLNSKCIYLSNSREMAVVAVKGGSPTFHSRYDSGDYSYPIPRHGGRRIHPTQKPLDLFRELIRKHSSPGDLVIDPFLGSGTTAVAALEESRQFAGCDVDESYTQAAKSRLRQFA